MSFRQSLDSIKTTVFQQLCGVVVLLALPRVMLPEQFAIVVFCTLSLSFLAAADLGLSQAYGRRLPRMLADNAAADVVRWEGSLLVVGSLGALIIGLTADGLIAFRFPAAEMPVFVIALVFPLVYSYGIVVSRFSARSDFSGYGRVNNLRAIVGLSVLPLALLLQASGWVLGMLLSSAFAFWLASERGKILLRHWSFSLLREHWREGVLLSLCGLVALQLMNFARLAAGAVYGDVQLASYGLVSFIAQAANSLFMAAALPVSVNLYRSSGEGAGAVVNMAAAQVSRFCAVAFPFVLIGVELAGYLIPIVYPAYSIDPGVVLATVGGSIFVIPLAIYGAALVALGRASHYLACLFLAIVTGVIAGLVAERLTNGMGAAIAQFIALATAAISVRTALLGKGLSTNRSLLLVEMTAAAWICITLARIFRA